VISSILKVSSLHQLREILLPFIVSVVAPVILSEVLSSLVQFMLDMEYHDAIATE